VKRPSSKLFDEKRKMSGHADEQRKNPHRTTFASLQTQKGVESIEFDSWLSERLNSPQLGRDLHETADADEPYATPDARTVSLLFFELKLIIFFIFVLIVFRLSRC
jgi:hypothetical protein